MRVRLAIAAFRIVCRVLPRSARSELLPMVVPDLGEMLVRAERQGWLVFIGTWMGAVGDVLRRAPHERRRAMTARSTNGRQGGGEMIRETLRHLRHASRALTRRPGFTVVATVTLALGIGANLAIFAVVNSVLIEPLPFPDSERIVSIRHHAPGLDISELQSSMGMINFYRASADALDAIAGFTSAEANLTGLDAADRVRLIDASPEIFDVLRIRPAMGRRFDAGDVQGEAANVLLLTDATWRGRFGADPAVLGRTLLLDGEPYEIVGVLPPSFESIRAGRFAMRPLYIDPEGPWGSFGMTSVARYRADMTFEVAERRIQDLQSRLADFTPNLSQEFLDGAQWAVTFQPMRERMVGDISKALWLVLGTVVVVFLIACANVANLFLVRAEDRQREIAIHAALGAGLGRTGAMILSESLVLGVLGGLVGIGLAALAIVGLKAIDPGEVPRLAEVTVDGTVAAASLLLSVLAGLFFGVVSFLRVARTSTTGVLRDGGMNATASRSKRGARNLLVTTQMALALVLLVGAGLMIRSVGRVLAVDPGFDPEGVLSVSVSLGEGFETPEAMLFYRTVLDRLTALPGVTAAGASNSLPLSGTGQFAGSVRIESLPRGDDDLPKVSSRKAISSGYFESLGIEIVTGRSMHHGEDLAEGVAPAWVNEAFVESFMPGLAPLGERIAIDQEDVWMEIVGVVKNTREEDLTKPESALIYIPMVAYKGMGHTPFDQMFVQVRSELPSSNLIGPVRSAIAAVDENVPVTSVRTMEEVLADSIATTTFTLTLLGIAAAIALLLGAVGLFGVVSYVVSRRTREIGVRVALGAQSADVQKMIVRQGFVVTGLGAAIGTVGALALSRVMASVLFEVSPRDPLTFSVAPAVLVLVSLVASWAPARRAARIDPVVALRAD